MTIHRIRLLGDPILRARCEPITKPKSTAVRVILDDMRETLRDWQSRFGSGRAIAAPQIGAPVRMVYCEMDQPWALINPEIIERSGALEIEEGCLSVPGIFDTPTTRAERIRVRALGRDGKPFELEASGLLAICIQHELDHLDGKLFVDYLSELKRNRIRRKLEKDKRNRPARVEGVRAPAL